MILIIDRKETHVSYDNQTLCIRRGQEKPQRIPIRLLDQLIVYGNPSIEVSVWRALSKAAVPSTLLSLRGSQEPAMLSTGLAVRLPFRRLQYRCAENKTQAHAMARWIITQKFAGYDILLRLMNTEQQKKFKQQRAMLTQKLQHANSIEHIMGLEGALAHSWFALLTKTLPKKWHFTGRNRQPPKDPFNSLLSLSYTLLMSDIRQTLISEGLDPAFGFLHQYVAGREALVLDFTELFRARVDFALYLWLEQLQPTDFSYSSEYGCRLTKSARPQFFQFWSEFREHCPQMKNNDLESIHFTPLTQQIRGKIALFRETLTRQEAHHHD